MALSSSAVFEVQGGVGSDNNGGGFVTGASGTDFSNQPAPQFALSGLTTAAANAIILSTSAAATMVGNTINITGGTNFITGVYQILSVSAGVSITVDRNCTSAAGVAGTGNVGGCFATIAKALAQMTVAGMQTYVKATATYSISTGLSTSSLTGSSIARIIGYTTTRGDGGQPTIQATANITMLTDGNGGYRFENLIFDGNTSTASTAATLSGSNSALYNSILKNFNGTALNLTGGGSVCFQCSITGSAGGGIFQNATGSLIKNCYINGNSGAGISIVGNNVTIIGNTITNNSGASTDGIVFNNNYSAIRSPIISNILYANGRDGVRITGNYLPSEISNNIFVNNAGVGLNTSAMSPVVNEVLFHHNAYFGNTGGARSGNNAGTGDVTLTGVPFVNAGSANYALNSTAGQGLACQAAGFPGVMPAGGTGFLDIGVLQHQSTGGGLLVGPGMTGGCNG